MFGFNVDSNVLGGSSDSLDGVYQLFNDECFYVTEERSDEVIEKD